MKTVHRKLGKWRSIFDQVAQKTLASGLSNAMKYAVVERVLAGKGPTVIAIRDPAGEAILARSLASGIAPLRLPGTGQPRQLLFNAFYLCDEIPEKI